MKNKQGLSDLSKALQAASLGWDLALPIVGGVLLGHALDNGLDTGYVFTVGLLFLGVFGGYYNMSRSFKRIERQKTDDELIGR